MVRFENDPDLETANVFCAAALRHGVYLHPNIFLCAAHQAADFDRALDAADAAMRDPTAAI
ncbi:MAG: hypothetical protein E5X67_06325 [Mesorhizobium sp.]|uniref:hypothetical protein n=1 Tax=Mesorhizobium sp. TaxID=1871066 RepID=UPI001227C3E8|nr:hypothetical protein [Mesorhizobium sp.]TIP29649.1 MAG: hypothetical protein E5X67_06325 [Mesorhizobium sp.]